jgi:hypothetical protein
MSDVIKFWDAVRKHTNDPREWSMLHPQEQAVIIQAINMILSVMNNYQG